MMIWVRLCEDWTRREPLHAAGTLRAAARGCCGATSLLAAGPCWARFLRTTGARRTAEGASIKRC